MARNSEIFLGDDYISSIKLGDDNLKIYLQDTLVYQYGISLDDAIVTCNVATYNGNPQSATTIQVNLSGSQLTLNEDFIVTSNSGGTNVGSYNVTIEGIGLYIGEASGTFTINKVTPTVTAPTAKTVTYNGTAQAIATAGSIDFGTLEYSTASTGTFTTSIPTKTSAGTYEVWYRVVGDSNINDVAAQKTTNDAVINKADVVITTAPTKKTGLVYNTSAQDLLNAGTVTGGTLQYSSNNTNWSTTIPQGTNVNTYTVYWRVKGDSNHNDYPSTMISDITISPKVVTNPTITLSQDTYTYDGNAKTPAVSSVNDGGNVIPVSEYTVSYSDNVNASTSAKVTISDNVNGNYTVSGTKTFTINKVNPCPNIVAPTPKTLTYNTSAQALANAGSTPFGTMQYCLNNSGGTYSTSVPSATNANVTYKVWYKVVGDSNVEDCSPQSIDCMIAEKRVTTPTIEVAACTYNGSAQTPAVTVKDGSTVIPSSEYTVTYSNNTNAGNGTVVISDNTLGNYYISGTTTFTIAKSAITNVTIAVSPTSFTYNSGIQKPTTVTVKSGSSTLTSGTHYTLSYSNSNSTNVGTYTISASPTSNYSFTTVSTNYSIGCSTPTAPTAKNPNWTGSAQALVNAGSTYGTMIYSTTSGGTYSTTIPTGTNAGSYEVWWKVSGNTNVCNYDTPQKVSCSIKKVAMSYTAPSGATRTYNASAQQLVSGGSATGGAIYYATDNAGSSSSTTIPTATNASGYDRWWKAVPDSNHSGGTSSWAKVTGTINKADQSAPTATGATTTYHNTATATASGGGGQGTLTWTNGNTRSATGSQDTYAYWAGNSNYNASPNSNKVTLTVNKATDQSVTVTLTNRTYSTSSQVVASATAHGCTYYLGFGSSSTSAPTSWGSANSSISQTNAGTYYVWYKGTADGNHNGNIPATYKGTVTISKADQSAPTATGATTTYNTTATATASGGGGQGSIEWSNGNTQTSVGSKTTKARWSGNSNYNASPYSNEVTVKMNKANQSAPTATVTAATYPRTSTASASGGGGQGTLTWTNGSTRTAIGSATTKAYWAGNGNYNASPQSNAVTLSVAKFTPTVTLAATNRAYNGNALYATASVATPSGGKTMKGTIYYGTSAGATTYSVSYGGSGSVNLSSVSVTNVGSATVYAYFTPDSTCNDVYNKSGNASKTFSVSCAPQSAPTATGATVYYHNTATATASGGGGVGTLTWTNGNTRTATGSQDTYAYWAGNSNYCKSPNSNKVTLTVNKATDQSITVTRTNRTCNGSRQVVASATSHGISNWYLGFGSSSTSAPTSWGTANTALSASSVGTYYIWKKGTADSNHSADIGATYDGTVTISKANQTAPTATGATSTYPTGATATARGGGGQGSLEWSNGSSRSTCGSQTTKARWAGNSCYNASSWSNEVTITVNKGACPSYTAPTAKTGLVYNGSSQTLYNAGSSSNGSFSYSNGTRKAAGSQTVSWTFTPTDSCRNGASGSFSVTIAKAAMTSCTAPTNKTLTYTGSNQALIGAGSVNGGTMYYKVGSGSYSTSIPVASAVGTYTVSYSGSPDSNHSGTCTGSVTSTISYPAMTCNAPSGTTYTYNYTPTTTRPAASGGSATGGAIYYATSSAGANSSTTVPTNSTWGKFYTYWRAIPDSTHTGGTPSWKKLTAIIEWPYVDMGSGLKWTVINYGPTGGVGHSPAYAWGGIGDYNKGTTDYYTGSTLPTAKDMAKNFFKGSYRLPTSAECNTLISNSSISVITSGSNYFIRLTSTKNSNHLDIPLLGNWPNTTSPSSLNTLGMFWTSTNLAPNGASYVLQVTRSGNSGTKQVTQFPVNYGAYVLGVRT